MAAASLELDSPETSALLDRLTREDVVGQLIERRGHMAELATEAGDVWIIPMRSTGSRPWPNPFGPASRMSSGLAWAAPSRPYTR